MNGKKGIDLVTVRLINENRLFKDIIIDSPDKAVKFLGEMLGDYDREAIYMINMNTRAKPINVHMVSLGTINQSLCSPREIFKVALLSNASMMILMHNHPSGNTRPSDDDVLITKHLIQAGELLDIPVADHIIVGRENGNMNYYSMRESGYYELFKEINKQPIKEKPEVIKESIPLKSLSEVLSKYQDKALRGSKNEHGLRRV
jgi:DNA repair proteins